MKKSITLSIAGVIAVVATAFFLAQQDDGHRHHASAVPVDLTANVLDLTAEREVTLKIEDMAYSSPVIRVKRGTKITWVNNDSTKHDIRADDGSFRTASIGRGESASATFRKEGVFRYHCHPHPFMQGTVIVEG